MPKVKSLLGSLTKNYKVYRMVFTTISTFNFFKDSYSHMIFLQVYILFFQRFLFTYDISTSLDLINNMKLLNAIYAPKAPIFTPYIF
jgi:hypothetical protein